MLACNAAVQLSVPSGFLLRHQPPELPLEVVLFDDAVHLQEAKKITPELSLLSS